MKGFLTPDGFYYEADIPLAQSDLSVPLRPAGGHRFDLSRQGWVPDRQAGINACHPPTHETHSKEEGYVDLRYMKLTIKDVIQASFAIIGLVSAVFTMRSDIQELRTQIEGLKKDIVAYEQQANEHNQSEISHWKQFREVNRRIEEIERDAAIRRRITPSTSKETP